MKVKFAVLSAALLFSATVFTGCQKAQTSTAKAVNSNVVMAPPVINLSATPTEAYKDLFAAVKSKNPAAIKQYMSKTTMELAAMQSQMQNKPVDEMVRNGYYESLMAPNLPALRDERIKDNYGALEAQKANGTWEDVYFVREDGGWKIAAGDAFRGTYQLPAKPASAANINANLPQNIPAPNNASASNAARSNSNNTAQPGFPHRPGNK